MDNMEMKRNKSFSFSRIALFAVGISMLTACGSQGGTMGDDQFAVQEVQSTSSEQAKRCRLLSEVYRTLRSVLR